MEEFVGAGLGLDHDVLRFERTTADWLVAGGHLRDDVAGLLDGLVVEVAPIGSSSVLGLLAKPIVDLAAGAGPDLDLGGVVRRLEGGGWIHRGDAGGSGGQVFVLESAPWHRVAHLHVVDHGGRQWVDYLRLRDLLRRDERARARYESVKLELAGQGIDRAAYQDGKADVVEELLGRA